MATTKPSPTAVDAWKIRRQNDDAKLIKLGRDRDLSTAPAWIGLPDLSGVDLAQTQAFPVDKKARPRKRRWGDDWRELVIGASPYNRNVAPVPEKPVITVQEAVARKMVKLRAKLGITADDLLPASVALEYERNDDQNPSPVSKHQAKAKAEAGGDSAARLDADDSGGHGWFETASVPNIGRWKKEADDMLSLLGTNADKCTHEYPMTELKRKVASSSSPSFCGNREPERQGFPQRQQSLVPENSSTPRVPSGGGDRIAPRGNADSRTMQGEQREGWARSYQMPQYRHDAPWPRPRPTAEEAAKARAGRRARAERGASTAADAQAEMEEKVSASLFGVVPEEFCRDAPPAEVAAMEIGQQRREDGGPDCQKIGRGLNSAATIAKGTQMSAPAAAAAAGSGDSTSTRSHRLRRRTQKQLQQQSPKSKRHRGTPTAVTIAGDENGSRQRNRQERSRRRLAAFLEGQADLSEAPAPVPCTGVDRGVSSCVKPPRSPGFGAVRNTSVAGRGLGDGNTRPVTDSSNMSNNSDQAFFGLGGEALAPTAPSESMTANFINLLEESLGRGVWADPVASQLARPLNAVLAYLPPEGARLHAESGPEFRPPGCPIGLAPVEKARMVTGSRLDIGTARTNGDGSDNTAATASVNAGAGITHALPEKAGIAGPSGSPLLTLTMENGAAEEAPRAVWLGRVAAVMEARGDRDEAVKLYDGSVSVLTGRDRSCRDGAADGHNHHRRQDIGGKVGMSPGASVKGDDSSPRVGVVSAATIGGSGGDAGVRNLFPYSARAHHLASMIERSYRRHFNRRAAAQTRVAASLRGYLARAGARRDRVHRGSAATFVARAWRRRMYRLNVAAGILQAVARGADGRRKARELRVFLKKAISAQAGVRMFLAKRKARRMRLETASAALVQALQRGFALRRERAEAISEIHGKLWQAALGLNRVARGFLHRRFAGMVRQFAVDEEIERSEAEAMVVAGAVRLAATRADIYLATDAGKAELAQETKRARAAAARAKILMRGASREKRRRASARDVFDSFDVDGSGTIDKTELKPLLRALGMAVTEAELKVVLASVDADGSGDISFSEFYAWFVGGDSGNNNDGLDDMMSEVDTRSQLSGPSTASPGRPSAVGASRGLRNAAGTTFAKVRRNVRTATGVALKEQARRGVVRRWVASVARQTQVRFREDRPPALECCVCHQAFRLYGDYWGHFGGGSLAGADLTCGREREGDEEQQRRPQRDQRGRLFLDPTRAVGEEWHRRRAAERQWARLLDERRCLEVAGIKAEAAEEARISPKGSTGARELSGLAAKLLEALIAELQSGSHVGRSTPPEEGERGGVQSSDEARSAVARLAFQAFDRDGNGALDVSDLADLLEVLKGIAGKPSTAGSGMGTSTGAAATGLGLEAAMHAMDEDQSGQIDIDEFMNWFNGYDVAAEWAPPSSSGAWPPEPGARLHVKVRSNLAGGDGRRTPAPDVVGGMEAGKEYGGDDHSSETGGDSSSNSGSDGSSDSGGSSSGSLAGSRSGSSKTTEHEGAKGVGAERGTKPNDKEKERKGRAVGGGGRAGIFGVWRKTKTTGADAGALANKPDGQKPSKRKRRDEKGQTQEKREEGDDAKRQGHRRTADHATGDDEQPASPATSTNGAPAQNPLHGRRAMVSSGRLMLRGLRSAAGSPAADPWKRHSKTLRAVAEHEARTLLFRRARLRAQADELARFRAARPPEFEAWSAVEFLEEHRETVSEITVEADASFVQTLHRNLRDAEEAVRYRATTRSSTPPTMISSTAGTTPPAPTGDGVLELAVAGTTALGASNTPGVNAEITDEGTVHEATSAAVPSDLDGKDDPDGGSAGVGGNGKGGGDGGSTATPGALASRRFFVRSLGRKVWRGRGGAGRNAPRRSDPEFAEIVKAAEVDAAASRRRELKTAAGRADIARTVLRLKVNKAAASFTATAAAAEKEEISKAEALAATTATGLEAARASSFLDGEARTTGPVETLATPATPATTATIAAARTLEKERKALVEKGVQLLGLFDADGSGAIDREELAPLLEQLGIWVAAEMAREVFPRLDLDCSGDIRQEELVVWLEKEGVAFRQTPLSRMLRTGQSVRALGSSSRRLQNQVRASMISRSRATARAETWDSLSGLPETPVPIPESPAPAGGHAEDIDARLQLTQETDQQQETRQRCREESAGKEGDGAAPVGGVTGGRKRGRALAARAAERRRRTDEQEREAERAVLVKRAEDEAERRVKRHWRTQVGAAELRRAVDRVRGAGEAVDLTLRAWEAGVHTSAAITSPHDLRKRREEERLRHLFRLFDTSCDGYIDAEELGRLLSRLKLTVSEPEVAALLQKMDGDGSGDVDFVEFSDWWHTTGHTWSKRPGARVRSAAASLVATVAPVAAARRDARRALISSARSRARAEVKTALRLDGRNETALLLAKTTAAAAFATANVTGNETPKASAGISSATRDASVVTQDPIAAASIFGDTLGANGGGGDGQGESSPNAGRMAAARASKLARAEAEAYADVKATLRTDAGRRELARRTRAVRLEWKAAVKAANRIARGKRPHRGPGKTPGEAARQQQPANASMTLVEFPFLWLLWRVHGSMTGGAANAGAGDASAVEIEPAELKYLGASLRQTLVGRVTRRVRGGEATILGSTLALGKTARVTNTSSTGGRRSPHMAAPEVSSSSVAAPGAAIAAARAEDGDVMTLSGIFDDDSDDEIRSLKTLTRVSIGELMASLHQRYPDIPPVAAEGREGVAVTAPSSPPAAADTIDNLSNNNTTRTKAQTRADLADIARLRLRMFFTPGVFRTLAKEALLAEGRAFERHELARTLALEDGEPWRLAEMAATKTDVELAGDVAPADVDRLRATAAGVAKLSRALAQGEDLAAAECRSFLKTSAGRAELRATTAATREQRRGHRQSHRATAAGSSRSGAITGVGTTKRAFSALNSLARDELRRAFVLCEADGMSGEISRAEAAHVLAYAGIPQTTVATAGRVRIPRQGKDKDARPGGRKPRHEGGGGQRRQHQHWHRRPQGLWSWQRKATNRSTKKSPDGGGKLLVKLLRSFPNFRRTGGGRGRSRKDAGSRDSRRRSSSSSSSSRAKICPTTNDHADGGVPGLEAKGPTTGTLDGRKLDDLDNGDNDGVERPGPGSDDHLQQDEDEELSRSEESEEEDSVESDQTSDGMLSLDMDVVDDVTNDEGFELAEMEILLEAARARQTRLAKAASLGRLLARKVLPTYFTDTRDARMVLMSRARGAGRDKAMHKFEKLLTIGVHDDDGARAAARPTAVYPTKS